jgi:hypothetical protein
MEEHLTGRSSGLELFVYRCYEIYGIVLRYFLALFVVVTPPYVTGNANYESDITLKILRITEFADFVNRLKS